MTNVLLDFEELRVLRYKTPCGLRSPRRGAVAQRIGGGRKSALRIYFWSLPRKLHAWIHGTPESLVFCGAKNAPK
jgi:hypothetical protein